MQFVGKALALILGSAVLFSSHAQAAGKASHVVMIVWDGMRADFVSPETTPHLCAAASNGVTFLHHHSTYPSMTEVNATALATGVYPALSSILGNNEFRPAFDPLGPIETDSLAVARKGDQLTGGHYIASSTVAETLHRDGLGSIVAGTKPVALLHDRNEGLPNSLGIDVFAGECLAKTVEQELKITFGAFPPFYRQKIARDKWTAQALTGDLWRKDVPAFSVLWLAEPDYSQHQFGPGSTAALAAIRSSDDNLGLVLKTLKEKHLEDATDVIVVSDHGFSTIISNIDIPKVLSANGFHASTNFTKPGGQPGDIMVVENGGICYLYLTGHDIGAIGRLVHFLQRQPFSGPIFTKEPVAGAFLLADAGLNSVYAPDIALSFRWKIEPSITGAPGQIYCYGGPLGPGQGQHASLSPTEMHNICFAFGPDFPRGMDDALPSGNVDIAPTILWILGVQPKEKMSGRVLSEALNFPGPAITSSSPHHSETEWKGDGILWRQYLDWCEVNGVKYLDEGNGGPSPQ